MENSSLKPKGLGFVPKSEAKFLEGLGTFREDEENSPWAQEMRLRTSLLQNFLLCPSLLGLCLSLSVSSSASLASPSAQLWLSLSACSVSASLCCLFVSVSLLISLFPFCVSVGLPRVLPSLSPRQLF